MMKHGFPEYRNLKGNIESLRINYFSSMSHPRNFPVSKHIPRHLCELYRHDTACFIMPTPP